FALAGTPSADSSGAVAARFGPAPTRIGVEVPAIHGGSCPTGTARGCHTSRNEYSAAVVCRAGAQHLAGQVGQRVCLTREDDRMTREEHADQPRAGVRLRLSPGCFLEVAA